jgi:hypothetical protein
MITVAFVSPTVDPEFLMQQRESLGTKAGNTHQLDQPSGRAPAFLLIAA